MLSDFPTIWKVMLYFLMAQKICKDEPDILLNPIVSKFKNIKQAMAEYNKGDAFSPEIINAIHFVQKSSDSAKLVFKHFKLGGEESEEQSFSDSKFQKNLFYLQKKFEDAFDSLKLNRNHILFIDGIDVRPDKFKYDDYLECIKGLANAAWEINTTRFANIKDSKGRLKIILILRPDIFASLRLTNLNIKFSDNSVLIDWRFPDSKQYRKSKIFEVTDKLLFAQQERSISYELGKTWDYYFPSDKTRYYIASQNSYEDCFKWFLDYSLFRPRDIVAMLQTLQTKFLDNGHHSPTFYREDFENRPVKVSYSSYMWSEVTEYLKFYYDEKDEKQIEVFFSYLRKYTFSYKEFCDTYDSYMVRRKPQAQLPKFFETADTLLQLLYDLNIIRFIDEENTHHFSYREKNYTKIRPEIELGQTYQIHEAFSTRLYAY